MAIVLELSKKSKEIFDSRVSEKLTELEEFRLSMLDLYNKRKLAAKVYGIAILIIVFIVFSFFNILSVFFVFSVLFLIGLTIYVIRPLGKFERRYLKKFRKNYAQVALKELFNYTYLNEKNVKDDLKKFPILNNFDFCINEDYLHGQIDDIKFEFTEVRTGFESANDIAKSFIGCVALLTMPKDFDYNLTVVSDHWHKDEDKQDNKLSLDSQSFNKYFSAVTNNEEKAKKLLNKKFFDLLVESSVDLHVLFNEEISTVAPKLKLQIDNNKKPGIDDEMATSVIEFEIIGNQVLILIRGQYDFLSPNDINTSVYDTKKLAVIEQQFNIIEKLAKSFK